MSLEFNDIVKLGVAVAKANSSAPVAYSFGEKNYSYGEMNEALRAEFAALAPSYREYKKNQNTIFALIEQIVDEVLPERVIAQYGQFAEIKQFAQGDKAIFKTKISAASKRRAKKFIGRVGLAGLYEVFKLDGSYVEVEMTAIGGAAQIGFEEFLDGRVDFADVLDIVLEGLDECIYVEIAKQLLGNVTNIDAANKDSSNSFDEKKMDTLLAKADAYGKATIYCTWEFAATMVPSDTRMSDAMKEAMWTNGYLGNYKGHSVMVLPQGYTDETNSQRVVNPSYAWIIPVGAEKPVKIAFEGQTIVDEYKNYDRSQEVQIYKKVGVATIFSNNLFVYQNTSLVGNSGNETFGA